MRLISDMALRTQQDRVDILANNIANINTTGYKANVVNLAETYDDQEISANQAQYGGIPNGNALGVGTGALYYGKRLDMSQGIISDSGNPLDMAIEGEGFFKVMTPTGDTAYSRAGTFQLDKNRLLVNEEGYPLQPPVTIPQNSGDTVVKSNGDVVITANQNVLGKIELVNFSNPDGLQQISDSLYLATPESGPAQAGVPGTGGLGEIKAGALEQSNVDLITSMTNLIQAQRAYQMDARLLQQGDQMAAEANALRR